MTVSYSCAHSGLPYRALQWPLSLVRHRVAPCFWPLLLLECGGIHLQSTLKTHQTHRASDRQDDDVSMAPHQICGRYKSTVRLKQNNVRSTFKKGVFYVKYMILHPYEHGSLRGQLNLKIKHPTRTSDCPVSSSSRLKALCHFSQMCVHTQAETKILFLTSFLQCNQESNNNNNEEIIENKQTKLSSSDASFCFVQSTVQVQII